jgi:hypothetical protein
VENNTETLNTDQQSSKFKYRENINALYFNYNKNGRKWLSNRIESRTNHIKGELISTKPVKQYRKRNYTNYQYWFDL